MRKLLISLLLLLAALAPAAAAAPPAIVSGPWLACQGQACAPADLGDLPLQGREMVLTRTVTIPADALPLERPLMVRIIAMASAELRWNGVLIGRNGMPGADPASEEPGLYIADLIVPAQLLRPGGNRLEVRLSAQHLWLPVRRIVHQLDLLPYRGEELPGLSDYLPALLALGALAAACLYFGASYAGERDLSPLYLALAAGAGILQLIVEVSRSFVDYSYPWHLARVSAVALLAAAASMALALYAARRFAPSWQRRIGWGTTAAAAASLVLIPWFDIKAIGAIFAGAIGAGVAAGSGVRRGLPGARAALAAMVTVFVLVAWQLTAFLDHAWFLFLAALLVALIVEQVQSLRRARGERDAESHRAAGLAERLARAEREGEPILALKDGARLHRVAESDLLYLKAADDYCEAVLADGRTLLVTMTLARLLDQLPPRFLRIHKSYAVNRAHVAAVDPRPGGGRLLRLSSGAQVPGGRSYLASAGAAFS